MICECSHAGYAGFDEIRFTVQADRDSGVYRDWGGMEPIYAEEQVPYSNTVVRELIGFTPALVTWRLSFGCRHQYEAFLARLGTTGTLTVLAGYQSLKGETITQGNPPRRYTQLDHVLLRSLPAREHHVDGYIEVEAQFQRAFDPATREAVVP